MASALPCLNLARRSNSRAHSSIGTPSGYNLQKEVFTLRLTVGTEFQVLFTPLPGGLFTFPSRYWCAIGDRRYLALDDGAPSFAQSSTDSVLLGKFPRRCCGFGYGAFTLYGAVFQPLPLPQQATVGAGLAPLGNPHNPLTGIGPTA